VDWVCLSVGPLARPRRPTFVNGVLMLAVGLSVHSGRGGLRFLADWEGPDALHHGPGGRLCRCREQGEFRLSVVGRSVSLLVPLSAVVHASIFPSCLSLRLPVCLLHEVGPEP
jgi:hypothetical protein